jgi:hypothetical protein
MFKKLIAVFLLSSIVSLTAFADSKLPSINTKDTKTEMWHVLWASYNGDAKDDAIFVKLDDVGKYYCQWDDLPPGTGHVEGYMYMKETTDSFQGQTYYMTDGDTCTMSGIIQGTNIDGQFYCQLGSTGKLTGYITVGVKNK